MIAGLFGANALAALKLPSGLDSVRRKVIMKNIGFVGTTKNISNGYLLGGYDGIEFSSQIESVPFTKINKIGSSDVEQPNQVLTRLGFAKGFYHNVEISFQFIPFFLQSEISGYSGAVKYTFYEDQNLPLTVDFMAHGGGINFINLLGVQSVGLDMTINYHLRYWTYYFGFGHTRIIGTFIGGDGGLTDDKLTATEDVAQNRVFGGIAYDFQTFQMGIHAERFFDEAFILKLGKRF